MLVVILVACAMIVAHEAAHAVTVWAWGGRVEGVVVRSVLAVGVKVRVDALTDHQVMGSLLAAPLAELVVFAGAWQVLPEQRSLWLVLLAVQWAANWIPWLGFPNDGHRLRQLWRGGRQAMVEHAPPLGGAKVGGR